MKKITTIAISFLLLPIIAFGEAALKLKPVILLSPTGSHFNSPWQQVISPYSMHFDFIHQTAHMFDKRVNSRKYAINTITILDKPSNYSLVIVPVSFHDNDFFNKNNNDEHGQVAHDNVFHPLQNYQLQMPTGMSDMGQHIGLSLFLNQNP